MISIEVKFVSNFKFRYLAPEHKVVSRRLNERRHTYDKISVASFISLLLTTLCSGARPAVNINIVQQNRSDIEVNVEVICLGLCDAHNLSIKLPFRISVREIFEQIIRGINMVVSERSLNFHDARTYFTCELSLRNVKLSYINLLFQSIVFVQVRYLILCKSTDCLHDFTYSQDK